MKVHVNGGLAPLPRHGPIAQAGGVFLVGLKGTQMGLMADLQAWCPSGEALGQVRQHGQGAWQAGKEGLLLVRRQRRVF